MAQVIVGTKLIVEYEFGTDSHGNPVMTKQTFSSVKDAATDAQFTAVGDAFGLLINSSSINVKKEELISLDA